MKKILPIIVVAIVVGIGAFYGGMKYGESSSTAGPGAEFANFAPGQQMGNNGNGSKMENGSNRLGGGFINGEIIAKDNNSITVQLPNDGGSKIVFFSDSTQIMKLSSGSLNDLKTGENVMVNGTANSEGSISAQSIQIRPPATQ